MNTCPNCNADLDGQLIYEFFLKGYDDEVKALDVAKKFGASKTQGRLDRKIGIYDLETDRTVAYQCPECNHQWEIK